MLKKLTVDKLGPYLKNKRVVVRVDFNVPIKNGKFNHQKDAEELPGDEESYFTIL